MAKVTITIQDIEDGVNLKFVMEPSFVLADVADQTPAQKLASMITETLRKNMTVVMHETVEVE